MKHQLDEQPQGQSADTFSYHSVNRPLVPRLLDAFYSTPLTKPIIAEGRVGDALGAAFDVAGRTGTRRALEEALVSERTRLVRMWARDARSSGASVPAIIAELGVQVVCRQPALASVGTNNTTRRNHIATGDECSTSSTMQSLSDVAINTLRQQLRELECAEGDARKRLELQETPSADVHLSLVSGSLGSVDRWWSLL